jgi:hypothetical protein
MTEPWQRAVIFYVLNDQSYYYCNNGQDHYQNFIIAHQHHLLITRMKKVTAYVVWVTPKEIISPAYMGHR